MRRRLRRLTRMDRKSIEERLRVISGVASEGEVERVAWVREGEGLAYNHAVQIQAKQRACLELSHVMHTLVEAIDDE